MAGRGRVGRTHSPWSPIMTAVITWLEAIVGDHPPPAAGGMGPVQLHRRPRPGASAPSAALRSASASAGDSAGERQAWDAKAFLSMPLTFVLIIAAGYIGSFIVLVPGAQTFESLKDLVVLLCIVLFGYPALIAVPLAYMLSDLIEGVPPDFVLSWAEGYFFWTAFVWMAYQLIGRNPDFRKVRTWGAIGAFVVADHAVRPGDVGVHLLGPVHRPPSRTGTSRRRCSSRLAITWVLAPAGVPGRAAAGAAVRMVLGGDPRPRQRARDRRPRLDLGSRPRRRRRGRDAVPAKACRSASSSSRRSSRWCSSWSAPRRSSRCAARTTMRRCWRRRLHQEASANIRMRLDDLPRAFAVADRRRSAVTRSRPCCAARPSARTDAPSSSTGPAR